MSSTPPSLLPCVAPLLTPLTDLPGVGAATAKLLSRLVEGSNAVDLLFHLPESVIDRRYRPSLAVAEPGRIATVEGIIERVQSPARPRQPWKFTLSDGNGTLEVASFSRFATKQMRIGARFAVSGMLETFSNRLCLTNPDHLAPSLAAVPLLDPVWPLTAGLFYGQIRRAMRATFDRLENVPEWHEPKVLAQHHWPDFRTALLHMHFPADDPALLAGDSWIEARSRAHSRLACDELLAHQLATLRAREAARQRPGRSMTGSGALRAEALAHFGYQPTPAQTKAVREIDKDMAEPTRMLRLVQGDVGAGKTLVALLAMLRAVEGGAQAALMAPTEILARQHFATFERLSPVPVAFLSGSVRGKARKAALAAIETGTARLVIGTHALVQESVHFADLGLAVVDEQHRFGVAQRLTLGAKGQGTDMLVMTATPIPRTLLLTHWGELQVSRLDGKPAGRKPIRTSLHSAGALADVLDGISRALKRGAQVFWVCPLVTESEVLDIAAAEARYAGLVERFGDQVALAHGQQDIAVREAALAGFSAGTTRILVATTVIEVGVDVPGATVMVIEHAERFGLAQLHQLRGRVGRGAEESFCLLLHDDALGVTAKRRLMLLRDTQDGFLIADEDFRLRGGGDATGNRQSGLPGFRLSNVENAETLVVLARQEAERMDPENDISSMILTIFGKSDMRQIISSG